MNPMTSRSNPSSSTNSTMVDLMTDNHMSPKFDAGFCREGARLSDGLAIPAVRCGLFFEHFADGSRILVHFLDGKAMKFTSI